MYHQVLKHHFHVDLLVTAAGRSKLSPHHHMQTNVGQTILSAHPRLQLRAQGRRAQCFLWAGNFSKVERGQALMPSPQGAASRDEAVGAPKHFSPSGTLALVLLVSKVHIHINRQRDKKTLEGI